MDPKPPDVVGCPKAGVLPNVDAPKAGVVEGVAAGCPKVGWPNVLEPKVLVPMEGVVFPNPNMLN